MKPSSRTPEGTPNRCPVCGSDVRIEPSQATNDAPCPNCGHLLWFSGEAASGRLAESRRNPTVPEVVIAGILVVLFTVGVSVLVAILCNIPAAILPALALLLFGKYVPGFAQKLVCFVRGVVQ